MAERLCRGEKRRNNKIFTKNQEKSIDFWAHILYNLIYMFFAGGIFMKKLLAILLAALMVVAFAACNKDGGINNNEDELYRDKTVIVDHESLNGGVDTFYYENVDSETVIIVGFSTTNDKKHDIKIPAYFVNNGGENPLRVVGIGKEAFNCSSSVGTLVFPTEEEYLALDAKFDMSQHTFTIAEYALRECVSLKTLNFPAYVTEIGARAFYGCVSLETVTFAEGSRLAGIGDGAFMYCSALKGVDLPGSTQTIGVGAFLECSSLASVIINEGTVSIATQAFQNCKALAEVKLPTTLESVGTYAFHGSKALYKDGFTYTGDAAGVKAYITSLALEDRPAE
jgi:hypothetical protein